MLDWQNCTYKLGLVKDTGKTWSSSSRASRREQAIHAQPRIDHCYLTHGHLIRGEPPPICEYCNTTLSVKNITLECPKYCTTRRKYYLPPSLLMLGQVERTLICISIP